MTTYADAFIGTNSMLRESFDLEIGGETVENIEGMARGILKRLAPGVTPPLEPCERDDAIAFMLGEAVVQAELYDATRAGMQPRPWLYDRLGKRLIDEWRSKRQFGRSGQYRAVVLSDVDGTARVDQLDGSPSTLPGDRSEDWADALEGLYDRRDREADREARRLGLRAPRRAKAKPDRAGARALGRAIERSAGEDPRAQAAFRDCGRCGWRVYAQAPNGEPGWHYPDDCPACGGGLT